MHTIRVAILSGLCMVTLGGCTSEHPGTSVVSAPSPAAEPGEAESGTGTTAATPVPASPAATGGGESRAFIDPVTGELRAPTAAELDAMQPAESTDSALKQQPAPVQGTRMPDGSIRYDMRNQPQVEEKVCVLADGSIGPCPAK